MIVLSLRTYASQLIRRETHLAQYEQTPQSSSDVMAVVRPLRRTPEILSKRLYSGFFLYQNIVAQTLLGKFMRK